VRLKLALYRTANMYSPRAWRYEINFFAI